MRKVRLATCVAVVFFTGVSEARDELAFCSVTDADRARVDGLLRQLAAREVEMARLRSQLVAEEEDSLYELARSSGIVAAVKASGLPERQQRRVAIAIVREAKGNKLDPLLVVAVIRTESSFHNYAVSPVGAMGLMQVMPGTAKWLLQRRGEKLGRSTNLFDPELNIELGSSYLADLIRRFGSVEKALVAYNAGPGAARKILADQAIRTRFMAGYPKKVLSEFQRLQRAWKTRLVGQSQPPLPDGPG